MAFVPKEWKDRLVEFAGRRKLTNVSTGEEMIVDVVRNEGAVSQEGDAFSAANMSDLEQRVADEFNNINTNLHYQYSTEEVNTGIKWIDGKPIYRKVIDLNEPLGYVTQKSYDLGISNIDNIISVNTLMRGDTDLNNIQNFPVITNASVFCSAYIDKSNSKFNIIKSSNNAYNESIILCILEYTKTTD